MAVTCVLGLWLTLALNFLYADDSGAIRILIQKAAAESAVDHAKAEATYLRALKMADRPVSPVFVPTVLAVAEFYAGGNEYRKAAQVLSMAYEQQSRAFVDPKESVPILEKLEIAFWSLRQWQRDAEVLGMLVGAASRDVGPNSAIVARYLLEQAAVLQKLGDANAEADARQRARATIRSLDASPESELPVGDAPPLLPPGGGRVLPPRLLRKVQPLYTDAAKHAHLEGKVVLKIVVDKIGVAEEFTVLHPLGQGLDEAAIDAVRRWEFAPGMKNGKPVAVIANVEVNFQLR